MQARIAESDSKGLPSRTSPKGSRRLKWPHRASQGPSIPIGLPFSLGNRGRGGGAVPEIGDPLTRSPQIGKGARAGRT
jgi:hypothetical protein